MRALSDFEAACVDYRGAIRQTEVALRKSRRQLDQGKSVTEVLGQSGIAEYRSDLADKAKCAEDLRHRLRLALIEAARQEGTSLGELARLWGLSRQLISRLAKEIGVKEDG
ncbi:MAG: hypothetical protein ACREQ5_36555 [Candidatus Dormibacteria bacterium]